MSEWLEVQVYKDGNIYQQRYERGKATYPLKIVGKCGPEQHGTRVTFLPDKEIFEETVYDYDTLKNPAQGDGVPDEKPEDYPQG